MPTLIPVKHYYKIGYPVTWEANSYYSINIDGNIEFYLTQSDGTPKLMNEALFNLRMLQDPTTVSADTLTDASVFQFWKSAIKKITWANLKTTIGAYIGGLFFKLDQTTPQTITGGQPIQDTLTASELVATDGSKKLSSLAVATYPSLTELAYVKGVTSAIQTQFAAKKAIPNVVSVTTGATITPTGNYQENETNVTALAEATEFQTPSGSPANNNTLVITIKDNGTARALTYVADYYGFAVDLPSTTILGKIMILNFVYSSLNSKWNLLSVNNEQ